MRGLRRCLPHEVDKALIEAYRLYMLRDLGYKMSSVAVYLRRLRQAFRRAMLEAGLREDPFDLIDIETPAYERNALSAEDLQRLLAYRPHRSVDNHVRLIFLLGCFTGLAFSDLKKLRMEDVYTLGDGRRYLSICRTRDDEDKLAARLGFFEMGCQLGQCSPHAFLVYLRDFPAAACLPLRSEHLRKLFQGLYHPVRRLVEDHRPRFLRQAFKMRPAPFLLRQEAFETEPVARQSARHKRRHEGRRTRQRLDSHAAGCRLTGQKEARIADARRPRIRDERNGLPCFQTVDNPCRSAVLIELMMRYQAVPDFKMLQQNTRGAGIFTQNQISLLKDSDGPERHILHIADRGRYEIQYSHSYLQM